MIILLGNQPEQQTSEIRPLLREKEDNDGK